MQEGSRKAIAAAFFANLGIAISKFVAFAITGAASMLAEAIHSVADTGNKGLLFLGGRRAEKAATELHQFPADVRFRVIPGGFATEAAIPFRVR